MSRLLAIVAVIAVISAVQPGRLFHTFMACQVSEQGYWIGRSCEEWKAGG